MSELANGGKVSLPLEPKLGMEHLTYQDFYNAFGIYWIGLCAVSWFVQYKLYKLLEKYHHEKWVWLGKPNVPFMFSTIDAGNPFIGVPQMFKITFRILGLPLKGDAELDKDERLNGYWKVHRIVSWIGIISFVGFFAVAIALFP